MRAITALATLTFVLLGAPATAAGAAAGGGGCHETTEGTGPVVELREWCFSPTVVRVEPGTTVTFVNRDPMDHDLAGVGWAWGTLTPGSEVAQRFDESGTYAYMCYLHPGMSGAVVVGDGIGSGPVVQITTTSTTASPPTTTVDTIAAGATSDTGDGADDGGALAVVAGAGGLLAGVGGSRLVARRRAFSRLR